MDLTKENLANAEIAFSNKQYNEALMWYQKVLEDAPDDVYVLSRAGSICVPLGKFEDALKYFGHARELDPTNGDSAFNYANACFFNRDNVGAFNAYVEAEKLGCSEDVTPRLYYQLALICSMRQDIKSALIYFKKCEETDKSGLLSLSPDMISEKMKLYMLSQDYANAAKTAAQLVAIEPANFRNRMVQFSILMANKDHDAAEKLLDDTKKYAELSPEDSNTLIMQYAAVYMTRADDEPEARSEYCAKAVALLERSLVELPLSTDERISFLLQLAEVCLKNEEYDKCIGSLNLILSGPDKAIDEKLPEGKLLNELSDEEIDAVLFTDMALIEDKIWSGELDESLGEWADIAYDENGHPISVYEDGTFDALGNMPGAPAAVPEDKTAEPYELSTEVREKVNFTMLSCLLAKEDFEKAAKYAAELKHSDNKYYNYYGVYTSALTARKLNGDAAAVAKKYDEAIAFFRNKTFADATDTLAVIFRARLYAEAGKYEKSAEIAALLADSDRKAVLDYLESCRAN